MDDYLALLADSGLPFRPWFLALAWAILFAINARVVRVARQLNDSLTFVTIGDRTALRRSLQPRYVVGQVIFAVIVFCVAMLLGGPAFVFFAGGLVVAVAWAIGANLQSVLSARAMLRPGEVSGSLAFSTAFSYRQLASRAACGAVVCACIGLVLAHLAPLGGALMLGSTSLGYLRRARKANAAA